MDNRVAKSRQALIFGTLIASQAVLIDELENATPGEISKIQDDMKFNCTLLYMLSELQRGHLTREEEVSMQ